MGEMMNYIFGSLRSSEAAIKHIQRSLKRQQRFNRNIILCTWAMTTYVILTELDRREQNRKIEKLSNEIEELNSSEGE
ncbi:MAG: hypothetical protein KH921_07055 [Erysipelotrichaceae bacterium]|nr:hypothetical protein [Erysipelotrichaceae bacterium]